MLDKRDGTGKRPEVVVITGASSGIGRATARRFAQDGARIALLARGIEGLEGACRDVEKLGGEALPISTDVADPEQVETAASMIEEHFGPIDIWINNAMVSIMSPVKEMQPEEYQRVTNVTYLGCVHGTLSALKRMSPRNRGIIVQVGSALAFRGIPLQSAYCGAKHAVQGFTESVRAELLHDHSNVWVTMVHLPATNTPQFNWVKTRMPHKPQPYPPIFQPEVPAEAIYYAAHHRRREMLVGWPTLKRVIGNRLFPGYVDQVLADSAYDGQQYDGMVDANRPDNLWKPVPMDFGAHGDFDGQAKSFNWLLWADIHRKMVAAGLLAVAALGLAVSRATSKTKEKV
jgi:NAD(P)-dependent dehydrogenase (short-subunit alcohol dehydrogenase family)